MASSDFESVVRLFAVLYESEGESRIITDFAGLKTGKIAFDPRALSNWYSIWRAAIHQRKELELVQAALRDTPKNEELLALERRLGEGSLTLRSIETSEATDGWDRQRLLASVIALLLAVGTAVLLLSGAYPLAIGAGAVVLASAGVAMRRTRHLHRLRRDQAARAADSFVRRQARRAFRGLYPFVAGDALPGRERNALARTIATQVSDPEFTFGVISGDVGCGKTSFLRAGLQPPLAAAGHAVTLIAHPRALGPAGDLAARIGKLRAELGAAAPAARRILILDQFEEFFSDQHGADLAALAGFLREILTGPSSVRVLVGVRHDFLLRVHALMREGPALVYQRNLFGLSNFSPAEAASAIADCAHSDDLQFDDNLPRIIAEDLSAGGVVRPPELQIVCTALRDQLTIERYRAAGAASGLLSHNIQGTIKTCSDPATGAKVLRALCDFSPTARNARPAQTASSIERVLGGAASRATVHAILQEFIIARLVVSVPWEQEGGPGEEQFALVHDYLVEAVAHATRGEQTRVEEADQLLEYHLSAAAQGRVESISIKRLIFLARYVDPARRAEPLVRRLLWTALGRQVFSLVLRGGLVGMLSCAGWFAARTQRHGWGEPVVIDAHAEDCQPVIVTAQIVRPDKVLTGRSWVDGHVRLWDAATGTVLRTADAASFERHDDMLLAVREREDDGGIMMDLTTGSQTAIPDLQGAHRARWRRSGDIVAFVIERTMPWPHVRSDGWIDVFSLLEHKELARIPGFSPENTFRLEISARLDLLIVGMVSNGGPVWTAWRLRTGQFIRDLFSTPASTVRSVLIDEWSSEVIALERDGSLHAWGGQSLQELRSSPAATVSQEEYVSLISNSEYLEIRQVPSLNEAVAVLRRSDFQRILPTKEGRAKQLMHYNHKFYLSEVGDKDAELWGVGPAPASRLPGFAVKELADFVVDRSATRLAVRRKSGDVELWGVPEGRRLMTLERSKARALRIFMSLDGNVLCISHPGGALTMYGASDGSEIARLNNLSKDDAVLYYDGAHRRIHVWTEDGLVLRYTKGTRVPWIGFFPSVPQPPESPRRCLASDAAVAYPPDAGVAVEAGASDAVVAHATDAGIAVDAGAVDAARAADADADR